MAKLLIVAWQEILFYLRQWTFYVALLAMPLLFAALGALPRLQSAAQAAPLPEVETVFDLGATELSEPVGYVDYAGLVKDNTDANFLSFSSEADATAALEKGMIEGYYVIAADYIQSGAVTHYSLEAQLLSPTDTAVRGLLNEQLTQTLGDSKLATRLAEPVRFVRDGPPVSPFSFIPADLDTGKLMSAALVLGLFVFVLSIGGNFLIRALQREVKAHVLEMMMVSTTPFQFIGGKLLGLSVLTLAQVGLTLIAGLLVYGQNPDGSGPAPLSVWEITGSILFLLLGFLTYGGVVIGVAALWPNLQERSTLIAGLRLVSLTPLLGTLFILPDADGQLAVWLTILPITSHLLMPFRLLITDVPFWQWGLGLLSLAGWTAWIVWLSVRLFRLNGMLTGRSVSPRIIWQALKS